MNRDELTKEEKAYLDYRKKRRKRIRTIRKIIKWDFILASIAGIFLLGKMVNGGVLADPRPGGRASVKREEKRKEKGRGEIEILGLPTSPAEKKRSRGDISQMRHDSLTALINKEHLLPSDYVPEDLEVPEVNFANAHLGDKNKLRKPAAEALRKLFLAAEEDGIFLVAVSGYRSYERQVQIYNKNVERSGYEEASAVSAPPGSSEHQSGLAMDISSKSNYNDLTERFGDLPEGKWVQENSYKFGFIIRYPKHKTKITSYTYEPWHLRYVGEGLAKFLYEQDLSLEEYYGAEVNGE